MMKKVYLLIGLLACIGFSNSGSMTQVRAQSPMDGATEDVKITNTIPVKDIVIPKGTGARSLFSFYVSACMEISDGYGEITVSILRPMGDVTVEVHHSSLGFVGNESIDSSISGGSVVIPVEDYPGMLTVTISGEGYHGEGVIEI